MALHLRNIVIAATGWLCTPLAPPIGGAPRGRLTELDGLRGWAALGVVCYHIFWETLYVRAPEMRNIVTGVFFDGGLAVSIFFVLSGEALSAPFFAGKGEQALRALAIKRYSRLAIPVFAACALVYLLGRAGLLFHREAAAIVGRPGWLIGWLDFPLTFARLVRYSLVDVFTLVRPHEEINGFLWTMGVELDCSFLVFAILAMGPRASRLRLVLVASATALALAPWGGAQNVSCFLVGLLFADARSHGGFAWLSQIRFRRIIVVALVCALLWDGVSHFSGHHGYKNLKAMAILAPLFALPPASTFLRGGLSQFLGRISFPLYLVQFAVIVSPVCWAIDEMDQRGWLDRAGCYALGFASVLLCIAVAWAFLPVEAFTRRFGHALVRGVRKPSRGKRLAADWP